MISKHSASAQYTSASMFEYLLVAAPDQVVMEKLVEERAAFHQMFLTAITTGSRPYITISHFLAKDEMEDTLLRWLQRIVGDQKSFPVTLNNYSGYPPNTVCLRVVDPEPFRELANHLGPIDQYIQSNACPPVKFNSSNHLSLAVGLPADVYERAIATYAQKLFQQSFQVNELILLRRLHSHDQCKQVAILRLQPGDKFSIN